MLFGVIMDCAIAFVFFERRTVARWGLLVDVAREA